jgi:hypothetical protein
VGGGGDGEGEGEGEGDKVADRITEANGHSILGALGADSAPCAEYP